MKNLHTPTNQPSPFYPDTGKDRRSPLGLTKFVDISGIEPEVLELTPVDWTSHPAETEHFLTREYTLILDIQGFEPCLHYYLQVSIIIAGSRRLPQKWRINVSMNPLT